MGLTTRQVRHHRPDHRCRRTSRCRGRRRHDLSQSRAARSDRRNSIGRQRRNALPARRHRISQYRRCRRHAGRSTNCAWSMASPTPTTPISATCSRTPTSACISTSTIWSAATSPSSAPPASASRAASPSSCKRFSRRARTCASSWSIRTTNMAAASATRPMCSTRAICGCRSGCSISKKPSTPSSAAVPASRKKSRFCRKSFRWPRAPICNTATASSADRLLAKKRDPKDSGFTADTPVPYRIEDLINLLDERMGKLENRSRAMIYHKLIGRIQTFRNHPRYAFMFENANIGGDTMAEILGALFRLPPDGKPMTIMQLAGFPAEVVELGGVGAVPHGFRLRPVERRRRALAVRLRRSAPLRARRQEDRLRSDQARAVAHRQGRPQIRRVPRPGDAAPGRNRRRPSFRNARRCSACACRTKATRS